MKEAHEEVKWWYEFAMGLMEVCQKNYLHAEVQEVLSRLCGSEEE